MRYRTELLVGLAAYLYFLTSIGCGLKWLIFGIAWYFTGGSRQCYLLYMTFPRDFKYATVFPIDKKTSLTHRNFTGCSTAVWA